MLFLTEVVKVCLINYRHFTCRFVWQVTANSVRLVSCTSRELVDQWNAPAGFSVNVASANASQVPFLLGCCLRLEICVRCFTHFSDTTNYTFLCHLSDIPLVPLFHGKLYLSYSSIRWWYVATYDLNIRSAVVYFGILCCFRSLLPYYQCTCWCTSNLKLPKIFQERRSFGMRIITIKS